MRQLRRAIALCVMVSSATVVAQEAVIKPPPPGLDVPDLLKVKPKVICGNCERPFDTATHKEVLEGLVSNPYNTELRKALYQQDILHQFESKAHFDNCDFDGATSYIERLLAEVDAHVKKAAEAKAAGDTQGLTAEVKAAFFALGQALHAVQDFYAHTNYVELVVPEAKSVTNLKIIAPWTATGRESIAALKSKGLVSGFVFWGFPQKCSKGTPSHGDLAKDSATTKSGAVKVAHLENRSRYQIAVQLAHASSQALVDYTFARWPLLKDVNGPSAAFEILVDRRGL